MDEYLDSFSHGPVVSKLWLCEELEKIMNEMVYITPTVNIFGGWVNVLGFMLQVRRPDYYQVINSYDSDAESARLSDKLCDAWRHESSKINNITADTNQLIFDAAPESIFINCSVDQFHGTEWYNVIPDNSIVCLQTTTLPIENSPWLITQETKNVTELLAKYPLKKVLFSGEKRIQYSEFGYTRLMTIGIK